jgi:putative transposase
VFAVIAPSSLRYYSVEMRRNLQRYYGAGDLHFITCSCYRRQPLLGTPRRRDLFLTVLEPRAPAAISSSSVTWSCPSTFTFCSANPKSELLRRFYDFNVWTEHKRIEKLRYMHRNPVQHGLVASPELWKWSSFRAYAFGEAGPVKVNDWEVLKMKIRPPAA